MITAVPVARSATTGTIDPRCADGIDTKEGDPSTDLEIRGKSENRSATYVPWAPFEGVSTITDNGQNISHVAIQNVGMSG